MTGSLFLWIYFLNLLLKTYYFHFNFFPKKRTNNPYFIICPQLKVFELLLEIFSYQIWLFLLCKPL